MRKLSIRVASSAAVAGLTLGLAWGTAPAASAATSCRTSYPSYPAVRAGSHGSASGAVQCLLRRSGYSVRIDRTFSRADSHQLARFQARHRLSGTGRADGRTWAALISAGSRPKLHQGSHGKDVARLQLSLRALGHRELPGTTYYGSLTRNGVKSLQRSLGWRQTGVATAGVWSALQDGGRRPVVHQQSTKKTTSHQTSSRGAKTLSYAKKQLGEPYRWGASGPNAWDCSGLTMKAWKSVGVSLPHSTTGQYHRGRKVAKSDLRPGDLVFFYSGVSHVGIYAGHGKVIHASRPGRPVAYIPIKYMPYHGARRPG